MGSFTEVVLSFNFAAETPAPVLAAVAALAVPDAREEVPRLPPPAVEEWSWFMPDWRVAGAPERDPFESEPWRHDWAYWLSLSMGGGTTPHGRLEWRRWGGGNWNLDCRFAWKTDADSASDALAWLAPYVEPTHRAKNLVGYAHDENAPRPLLFWVEDGRWEPEDLNPNDNWAWGLPVDDVR